MLSIICPLWCGLYAAFTEGAMTLLEAVAWLARIIARIPG